MAAIRSLETLKVLFPLFTAAGLLILQMFKSQILPADWQRGMACELGLLGWRKSVEISISKRAKGNLPVSCPTVLPVRWQWRGREGSCAEEKCFN